MENPILKSISWADTLTVLNIKVAIYPTQIPIKSSFRHIMSKNRVLSKTGIVVSRVEAVKRPTTKENPTFTKAGICLREKTGDETIIPISLMDTKKNNKKFCGIIILGPT